MSKDFRSVSNLAADLPIPSSGAAFPVLVVVVAAVWVVAAVEPAAAWFCRRSFSRWKSWEASLPIELTDIMLSCAPVRGWAAAISVPSHYADFVQYNYEGIRQIMPGGTVCIGLNRSCWTNHWLRAMIVASLKGIIMGRSAVFAGVMALAAAAISTGPASAQEMVMKGGQWTSTMTGMGPPRSHSYCMADAPLDKMTNTQEAPDCTKKEITRIANGVKMDFVCSGMAMQGTSVSTGENAFRTEMTMNIPGGQTVRMVTESKRTGACNPGEKPVNTPE